MSFSGRGEENGLLEAMNQVRRNEIVGEPSVLKMGGGSFMVGVYRGKNQDHYHNKSKSI